MSIVPSGKVIVSSRESGPELEHSPATVKGHKQKRVLFAFVFSNPI
jgi:hypothetical protein